jgi:hypothetical protein
MTIAGFDPKAAAEAVKRHLSLSDYQLVTRVAHEQPGRFWEHLALHGGSSFDEADFARLMLRIAKQIDANGAA